MSNVHDPCSSMSVDGGCGGTPELEYGADRREGRVIMPLSSLPRLLLSQMRAVWPVRRKVENSKNDSRVVEGHVGIIISSDLRVLGREAAQKTGKHRNFDVTAPS